MIVLTYVDVDDYIIVGNWEKRDRRLHLH